MLNRETTKVLSIVGLIKKEWNINESIFSKTKIFRSKFIELDLDLSNYATKADLKNATDVGTSDLAKKNWFN